MTVGVFVCFQLDNEDWKLSSEWDRETTTAIYTSTWIIELRVGFDFWRVAEWNNFIYFES